MAGSYNNCILEDWCRAAWKGDDWLNPVCAGQDQYAGMQVLKEMQGLYIATLAIVLVAVQQSFYQVTIFHSFIVYNIMFCCDNIILELSYILKLSLGPKPLTLEPNSA